MNDERLRRLYQRGIAERDARDAGGAARDARDAGGPTGCDDVSPEELLALARGELPEARRLELLDVVMSSERCRSEFELLRAVVVAGREEPAPARGTRRAAAPWWRRATFPMALAATALVAVGLSRILGDGAPSDVMRGAADGATDGVVAVAPAAEIAPGTRPVFVWRAVPGASRYRFELLDVDGDLLLEAVTRDTAVVLPDSVVLGAGSEHRWIVRAIDSLGAPLGSAVRPLRVTGR